jgi:hypothetical protein
MGPQLASIISEGGTVRSNRNDTSFMAVAMVIAHIVVFMDTNVLEEHTAYIFRAEVCRFRKSLGYTDRKITGKMLMTISASKETSQVPLKRGNFNGMLEASHNHQCQALVNGCIDMYSHSNK